ncbi:MAG: YihY/virulence factor BrkB family protein [Elusimicrobiota bacterium]
MKISAKDKLLMSTSESSRLNQGARRFWNIPYFAAKRFSRIDGTEWAGSFAFNASFSMFPLIILLITIASSFVNRGRAGKDVIARMEGYVPMSGGTQRHIFGAIAGVIKARGPAGAVAVLVLIWAAHQCFTTLVCATNRAWGVRVDNWWRTPLKSLALLGATAGAILLGMAAPTVLIMAKGRLISGSDFHSRADALGIFFIPLLVVFLDLSLFYRLAPHRSVLFSQVWAAALCATVLLRAADSLFVIYLKNFATLTAVYGALGGGMAFLLWIYLSGCIFIFGACVCAAQATACKNEINKKESDCVGQSQNVKGQ